MDIEKQFQNHTHSGIDSKKIHLRNVEGNLGDIVTPSDFISDPDGGLTVDAEARIKINAILDLLIEQGLMDAS